MWCAQYFLHVKYQHVFHAYSKMELISYNPTQLRCYAMTFIAFDFAHGRFTPQLFQPVPLFLKPWLCVKPIVHQIF